MNTKLNRSEASRVRFPWWSLIGALILTAGVCVGLVGSALSSYHFNVRAQHRYLRFEELRGVILLLDEVLTMSAHMAAVTGEREWEDRYHRFEPQLDTAIKEARLFEPHDDIQQAAVLTDAANLKLVEMEHGAFELVHQGQLAKARAILSSADYLRQKQAYSDGMSGFIVLVANHLKAMQASEWRKALFTVVVALAGLGLALWFWIVVIRRIHRWRAILVQAMADLTQADQSLRQSQEQLEVRVRERTAKLSAEIAERHRVEGDLQASVLEIRTLSATAQDAIIVMDHDGRISVWNEAAERIFGYPKSEAVGKALHDLLTPPVYRAKQQQAEALWRETGQGAALGKTLELIALRKGGASFPVEISLSAMQVKGEFKALGIVRDITVRKRYESELKQARFAAETSTQAKSEFLANMSHEIRTPMNGVIGMANLLLDTDLTPQQQHYANTIHQSGEALLNIINDILDFSKIEAGKLVLERLDFDLRQTVENALDLMAEPAGSKHLELAVSLPAEVPTQLRGDPGRLRQILLNLVSNAIKFTPRGHVIVRLSLVSETATHARVRCEVQDTGMGISPDGRARLFRAFSQADNSMTRKFGGTGLGLTISKQLAELMGGQIGVDSETGKGSAFWFTAELEKQAVETPARVAEKPDLVGLRVLIVGDNPTLREILERQLQTWNVRTRGTAPSEALELLREASAVGTSPFSRTLATDKLLERGHSCPPLPPVQLPSGQECPRSDKSEMGQSTDPFQVTLLDAGMPGLDGLSLARAIKADPAISRTRLILLSRSGQKLDPSEITAAGIAACLTKPVKQSRLWDCLATVMDRVAPRAASIRVPAAPVLPAAHSLRLLLAEDNEVNQEVTTGQLRRLGYQADVVSNGLQGLDSLQRVPYDAVLMDCQMPEMDGYEATRKIRLRERSEQRKPVWIIAMTASIMPEDRDVCLASGMNDFIGKPTRDAELQKALDRCESAIGKNYANVTSLVSMAPPLSVNDGAAGPPVVAAVPEPPAVDLERLHEVSEGGQEGLRKLVALYLKQADGIMSSLKTAIQSAATKEVRQLAHKLGGSSSACGMTAILAPLLELERQGQRGRLTDADQVCAQADRQLESIRHLLADHLLSLQPVVECAA